MIKEILNKVFKPGERVEKPYATVGDDGSMQLWVCKSCKSPVTLSQSGGGRCKCTKSPSPWEKA